MSPSSQKRKGRPVRRSQLSNKVAPPHTLKEGTAGKAPGDPEKPLDAKERAHRAGMVALIGRPNVGKSTLLNVFLDYKLAIVSARPQTTRHQILGIVSGAGFQVAFLDTPGLMERARDILDRRMSQHAHQAMESADLVVMLVDPRRPGETERRLASLLEQRSKPAILAINKVDRVKKETLLPVMEAYQTLFPFQEMVPISALRLNGTALLLELIAAHLPESEPLYAPDTITDRSERFLAAELVREQLFRVYGQEVPYDTAVEIEEFRESTAKETSKDLIQVVIYVNKTTQQRILVGSGGAALKEVGISARSEIEAMLGRPIYLELWVKVRPGWREDAPFLQELGY